MACDNYIVFQKRLPLQKFNFLNFFLRKPTVRYLRSQNYKIFSTEKFKTDMACDNYIVFQKNLPLQKFDFLKNKEYFGKVFCSFL